MLVLGVDWATISSLATAGGTLVLAIATFAAVRSSNRSARIAEVALQEQRRPIFTQSRLDDPVQKIMFVEGRWVAAGGGHGVAEHDGNIYLAMSLRNVGSGIGVCQGWRVTAGLQNIRLARDHTPVDQFRLQTRDLYIPAGDIGMWQGALRDRNDPTYGAVAESIDNRDAVSIELLYSDQVGDQRTITRFLLTPYQRDGKVSWFASINRHWYLDRAGPRSDEQVAAAADTVLREREVADELTREEAEAAAQAATAERAEGDAADQPDRAERAERTPSRRTAGTDPAPSDGDGLVRPEAAQPVTVIPRPNCE
jgi:hypothetical protein